MSRRMSETARAREETLQERFNELMPCSNCKLLDLCKYANSIKRLDYEPEIFTISITCKSQQPIGGDKNERKGAERSEFPDFL